MLGGAPPERDVSAFDLLRRPEVSYDTLLELFDAGAPRATADADERLLVQVQRDLEVRASYAGYIERAHDEIERARAQQDMALPPDLDYSALAGLSHEVRQRLTHIRPLTIGQAARVQGVTPVAISILLVHLRRRGARVA